VRGMCGLSSGFILGRQNRDVGWAGVYGYVLSLAIKVGVLAARESDGCAAIVPVWLVWPGFH